MIERTAQIEDPNELVKKLLDTIDGKLALVLTHRFGLLGKNPKVYREIAKIICTTIERVRLLEAKGLRVCRDLDRKELVDNLPDGKLKKAITEGLRK